MVVSHCNVWLLKGNSTDPGSCSRNFRHHPAAGVSSLAGVLAGENGGLPWNAVEVSEHHQETHGNTRTSPWTMIFFPVIVPKPFYSLVN
jgi:hypothetical protein